MTGMEVRYARSGDIDIAYRVIGDGPIDVMFVPAFISHLDLMYLIPFAGRVTGALLPYVRLVTFDKRGTGLSDRSLGAISPADRMDDIRAVADEAGIERFAIIGVSEAGPLSMLFTATYPGRVSKLALFGTFARYLWSRENPGGVDPEEAHSRVSEIIDDWGTGRAYGHVVQNIPEDAIPDVAKFERNTCTPRVIEPMLRANLDIDVREALPLITCPTLVMHAEGDPVVPVELGRSISDAIASATLVEYPGDYHVDWNIGLPTDDLVEFLTGEQPAFRPDRMLSTVLFTDIVSSTELSAKIGDRRWRDTLDRHDEIAREQVKRFDGRLIRTTGDGVLATFDGPARAIGCARELLGATRGLGIDLRAGLHAGEIELRGEDVSGLGVVIARRVCDLARGGEVLTSRTVKDLVVGSDISFGDRGIHSLKGVPDDWQLFAVS